MRAVEGRGGEVVAVVVVVFPVVATGCCRRTSSSSSSLLLKGRRILGFIGFGVEEVVVLLVEVLALSAEVLLGSIDPIDLGAGVAGGEMHFN